MTSLRQVCGPFLDARVVVLVVLALALAHAASADFEAVDANHDGSIDREEYQRIQPAVNAFHNAYHIMDGAAKTLQADPLAGGGSALPNLQDDGFVSAFFNALVSGHHYHHNYMRYNTSAAGNSRHRSG